MATYAFEQPDGSVVLVGLGTHKVEEVPGYGEAVRVVELSETPHVSDPYRPAWRLDHQGSICHCLETARGLHKDLLRSRRKERFAETDVALTRALLEGRDAGGLSAFVASLRDVTADPRIAAAETITDLAAVWPDALEAAVPAAGDRLPRGAAPSYDTKALEDWARGLQVQVAEATAERKELANGVLDALHIAQAAVQSVDDLKQRLAAAEKSLAQGLLTVMKNTADIDTMGLKQGGAQ